MLALAALLLWGSLAAAGFDPTRGGAIPYGDEAQHILAYAALAGSVTYAWLPETPRPLVRGAVIFLAVVAYGATLEGLQLISPVRDADWGDAAANAIGASSAFVWDSLVARWTRAG